VLNNCNHLLYGGISCFVFIFSASLDYSNLLFHMFTIGGREKAPAAFCRKTMTSIDKFEMWGDGLQTRSFTFIDECVEGVLR